jgi:hypothetical protein
LSPAQQKTLVLTLKHFLKLLYVIHRGVQGIASGLIEQIKEVEKEVDDIGRSSQSRSTGKVYKVDSSVIREFASDRNLRDTGSMPSGDMG